MSTYNNPATREEKAEALRNERRLRQGDREPSTYHKLAGLSDDLGGRFRVKESISGEEAAVHVPRLPENSPWAGDPVPPEEPLGYSINDLAPTGETHELGVSSSSSSATSAIWTDGVGGDAPSDLVEAVALTADANAVVKSRVDNSPACDETASTKPPTVKLKRRKLA
jgi:hypothetical protein